MALYQQPTNNNLQYTLNTQLAQGGSTAVLSSSVAGVVQAPGVFVVDRVDSAGNKTASVREYISFTGVSGANLTGLSKGLAGSTDQVHNVGAIVEFVPDVTWANAIYTTITQEHSVTGQHTSLASISNINTLALNVPSTASIRRIEGMNLNVASLASITQLVVGTMFSASGASIQGIFPSAASGLVYTSNGSTGAPVWSSVAGGTGGFNAVFQVPGGLASQGNIGGLVPVSTAFNMQFLEAFVQTPASVASISVILKKNLNTTVGMVTILAGATYGSSASISSAALVGTDNLTIDINSTASLATDLSVMVRAT